MEFLWGDGKDAEEKIKLFYFKIIVDSYEVVRYNMLRFLVELPPVENLVKL